MAIPDYQTLMRPVLEVAAESEISVRDCTAALADRLGLSGEERSERLPSGRQTVFANRVHWAKTYLSQAGLLEMTRRGHFKATPRGREVLRRHPQRVDNEVLMHFPEFLEFRERSRSRGDGAGRRPMSLPWRSLRLRPLRRSACRPPTTRSSTSCGQPFSIA